MITTLEIGGWVIPTETLLTFDQQYRDLKGERFARTADGSGIVRTAWQGKVATQINGTGWVPSGFENITAGSSYLLKCAMPRSKGSATTTVTVPANRRTDVGHQPIGYALVGDSLVETPITNLAAINAKTTNDATLTAVAGALHYRVHYWPEITAVVIDSECRGDNGAEFVWRVNLEEI
jgi:hypothetical protein